MFWPNSTGSFIIKDTIGPGHNLEAFRLKDGRVVVYVISKDGVNWITDPGEAYLPGVSFHEDGKVENWFKYERIKIFQDKYGRAI